MNIPSLTGARFFAAAAIVLLHSQVTPFFKEYSFWPFDLSGGVPFFFVLSGFVLSINAGKYRSWNQFLIARIARVWPAHAAAIVFLFAIFWPYTKILLWDDPAEFRVLWLNLGLLHAWVPKVSVYWSLNAPSWSVSVEMFFYATFPAMLWLMRHNAPTRLVILTLGVITFQMAIWAMFPTVDPMWLGHCNPITNLPIFATGVAAGEWFKRNGRKSGDGTAIQFAALALMVAGNAAFNLGWLWGLPKKPLEHFIATSGATPVYAALILALARYDGVPSRMLALPAIVFLGEISYSLYLFHQLIIRWYSDNTAAFAGIPIWVQYCGVWTASLGVSIVCYFLIENPGRRGIIALGRLTTKGLLARHAPVPETHRGTPLI